MSDIAEALHDPGGKVKARLPEGMNGTAEFSHCGKYRYWLRRDWNMPIDGLSGYVLWIGMNPSTASADFNDPTITREINFTRVMNYSSYIKVNVSDYRATFPKDIKGISTDNLDLIYNLAKDAEKIVMAHGVLPPQLRGAARDLHFRMEIFKGKTWCLGKNKDGSPKHPLYLPKATSLETWP